MATCGNNGCEHRPMIEPEATMEGRRGGRQGCSLAAASVSQLPWRTQPQEAASVMSMKAPEGEVRLRQGRRVGAEGGGEGGGCLWSMSTRRLQSRRWCCSDPKKDSIQTPRRPPRCRRRYLEPARAAKSTWRIHTRYAGAGSCCPCARSLRPRKNGCINSARMR